MAITATITSFFQLVKEFLEYKNKKVEHQETTTILKDRKGLQKAVNVAEKYFELNRPYENLMSNKDKRMARILRTRFNKVD